MDPILAGLPKARRLWAKTDPKLAALVRKHAPPPRHSGGTGPFQDLVESLIHQQVSLASGRAIHARVKAAAGGRIAPAPILALSTTGLRAAGLSRQKAAYVLDLAERVASKDLDFRRLSKLPDAEVVEALVEVKGIGVWTAKMFLIFHLGRPDVVAHEDLGVQIGAATLYKVPRVRVARFVERRAARWSPYGTLACLALWHWRKVADGLSPK